MTPPASTAYPRCPQFWTGFYRCLTARTDALFELTDAVLCADRPAKAIVDLSLTPEHRRGHGAMYDGLNHDKVDIGWLGSVAFADRWAA
jgi:hypothetical protein